MKLLTPLFRFRRRVSNLWKLSGAFYQGKDGVLVTEPGIDYTILDCSGAGVVSFLGFVDLSSLGAGDTVDIRLVMSIKNQLLNTRKSYRGPVEDSLIDFSRKEAINPVVILKQTTGVSRRILFNWRWIKL